jgi:hypothetical protein
MHRLRENLKKTIYSLFVLELLHIDLNKGKLHENKKNVLFLFIVNYLSLNLAKKIKIKKKLMEF